jgi:hypothetical protein
LLDRHGAVCVGSSLLDAFCRLETMEHQAKIMLAAHALGAVQELPCGEAVRLRRMGLGRYGGPPEALARAADAGADLPPACLTCPGCDRSEPLEAQARGARDRGADALDLFVAAGIRRVIG